MCFWRKKLKMPMRQLIVYLRHTLTEEHVYEYFLLNAFLIAFRWTFLISIKGDCLFMCLVKGASL
jgi:hypothetical protein